MRHALLFPSPIPGPGPGSRSSRARCARAGIHVIPSLAWILALLLAWCPGQLAAALAWDKPEQTAYPGIADKAVKFTYSFTNTGATPVTITSIKPSCSCTAAKLSKAVYAPGESGSIQVTFTIGSRTGSHTKTVSVLTDDPAAAKSVLTLHVKLPAQAEFSHRILSWTQDAPPDPQVIAIQIPETLAMTISAVVVDTPKAKAAQFTAVLVPQVQGKSYALTITPISTAAIGTVAIEVQTNLKTYKVYARVAPPRPTAGLTSATAPPQAMSGTVPAAASAPAPAKPVVVP